MNIAVAGTGYVGLVTAAILAHIGHNVVCVDIDKQKIDKLNAGESVIYEPGLSEILEQNKERMTFTTDSAQAYHGSDVIFIAVGTPEKADGSANLSFIYAVAEQIAKCIDADCVVAVKSTVPIGTNNKMQLFMDKNKKNDVRIEIVSNPEFLSQGTAVQDMLGASRIVVGTASEYAKKVMENVYKKMELPVLFTDLCSAEMIKYASNDFLALKISYINEIANLCEILGADIDDVSKGMGMDPRIGEKFLRAGIGYGGSCFPKDTKALHWISNYYDNEIKTVKAAVEINQNQKIRLIKKARKYYDSLDGLTAAVLGLTFKPGTDDLREAPSLDIIPILLDDGVKVKVWDPVAVNNFRKFFNDMPIYCDSIEDALAEADICFILTEWPEVKKLNPKEFLNMRRPVILDGRNCYSLSEMNEYSLIYDSIGRRVINNLRQSD
ncbi:MAG: UDP-glucose dehydrogenase family protein [Christensenellales bacterium]|jgi:UDPglucose 6-dehydrogenase